MKTPRRLRGYAYQMFYRLPGRVRRQIVRLIVRKYLVGAVTIITDSDATDPGRLLLLRQPPGRGWGLPAGLLKRYEPPAVGAARELFEEAGVRLDPDDLEPATPNAIVHAEGWIDVVFHGSAPASSTTLEVDGGEVLEARWFPLDDLPPLTPNTELLLGVYGIGPAAAGSGPGDDGATAAARRAERGRAERGRAERGRAERGRAGRGGPEPGGGGRRQ